jgi:hypothetical protein
MSDQGSEVTATEPVTNEETAAAATETTDGESAEATPEAPAAANITPERVLDVMLGTAVLAAEGVRRTAQQLRENAPSVMASLEEKGRPLREQILGKLGTGSSAPDGGSGPTGGSASTRRAEDDIAVLERRVRELEQQLATVPTEDTPTDEAAPSPVSFDLSDVAQPDAPTTAEDATFVPGPDPAPAALADSPYAMSETDEEAEREEQAPDAGGGAADPKRGRRRPRPEEPSA